jgi:tetratricopeptide (TPR) repeat protein
MMPKQILALVVLVVLPTAAAQDFTDELTTLIELSDNKRFAEAIEGYRRLLNRSTSPRWLKAGSQYEIAELYAKLSDRRAAEAALRDALDLGFDDCQSALKSETLAPVVNAPDVRERLRTVRMSEQDALEIAWLKAEVEHAEHDAKSTITENVNRVDQQETVVPQASIPTRPTESVGVHYWREQLRIMQAAQRTYVLASDRERMVHAVTMQSTAGGANSAAIAESGRQARARAESRRLQIQRRAFKVLPNSTAQVRPCS